MNIKRFKQKQQHKSTHTPVSQAKDSKRVRARKRAKRLGANRKKRKNYDAFKWLPASVYMCVFICGQAANKAQHPRNLIY